MVFFLHADENKERERKKERGERIEQSKYSTEVRMRYSNNGVVSVPHHNKANVRLTVGIATCPRVSRLGTDIRLYFKEPVRRGQVDHPGNDARDDLDPEHDPGRDLHVVAQFEVLGELEGLHIGDVAVSLEGDVGDRVARHQVSDHVLGDDIEPRLLVRDRLDDPDGQRKDEGDGEGDDEVVPWQIVPADDCNNRKSE